MAKKIIITLVLIAALIGLDVFAVDYYCRYLIGYETVYVASHQLFQRTLISDEDIEEIKVPKGYLSNDVYQSIEDIKGKYVKLSYSVPKGSLFYKGALEVKPKDEQYTLLLKDQVSYDIYTTEAKVNSGTLSKNMYVDLYLTISNNGKPVSDLLLSDARIIGLYDSNEQQIQDYDQNSRVYIIDLAVDKKDVNYLNKAFVLGEIKVIVSSDTYSTDKTTTLNQESAIFEYLK